jgi:hypothetical protein
MDVITCEQLFALSEISDVKKIVEKVYKEEGYTSSESDPTKIPNSLGCENAIVFGAKINGNLFGTISVVVDSEIGLPMDSLYRSSLNTVRAQGKILAEFTQFAVDENLFLSLCEKNSTEHKMNSLLIFSKAVEYATTQNVNVLCIMINPKYVNFYKSLGLEIIGEEKYYPEVNSPTVGMVLNLDSNVLKRRLENLFVGK